MNRFVVDIEQAGYGELVVVPRLSLAVEGGEMLVLLGSNGAGKTTSLRATVGTVTTGLRSLTLDDEDLSALNPWQIARRAIAFVPDGARCFANASVEDNLTGALEAIRPRADAAARKRRFERVFELFPILRDRRPQLAGSMSGGQRQMLAIGRALMIEPRVLILDEPSAGLAPQVVDEVFATIKSINSRGVSILMVEQKARQCLSMSDHGYVLDMGQNRMQGSGEQLLNDREVIDLYLGSRGRLGLAGLRLRETNRAHVQTEV
jgi:branched-chain amino acid transport system ATP-binding protein